MLWGEEEAVRAITRFVRSALTIGDAGASGVMPSIMPGVSDPRVSWSAAAATASKQANQQTCSQQ